MYLKPRRDNPFSHRAMNSVPLHTSLSLQLQFLGSEMTHFHSSKTPLGCHFLGEVFVFQATRTCSIGFLGRFCLFLHHCLWPYRQKTKTTVSHFPLYHQRLKAGVVVRSHSLAGAPGSLKISSRFSLNPCGVERALGSTVKCWAMFYSLLFILLAFCILLRSQINHTKRFSLTY